MSQNDVTIIFAAIYELKKNTSKILMPGFSYISDLNLDFRYKKTALALSYSPKMISLLSCTKEPLHAHTRLT